jgi:hypothetical protein
MSYLRKTLLCFGFIFLISLIKKIVFNYLPEEVVFINNFLSVVQIAILIWTILILTSELTGYLKSMRKKLLIFFLILAIPEIVITYWLYHPAQIPSIFVPVFRHHYLTGEENIIQFNPNCSQYNNNLFYILKPSARFSFNGFEYSDSFYTNKLGLRDDEISLSKPEIICLGDSYTMGWGVKQNETFAKVLEKLSNKKVLNAGISSYGTARELKNLYNFDTSNLKYLIIQYGRNDFTENEQFVKANYSLTISPENKYKSAVNVVYWSQLWFPGKHSVSITRSYLNGKISNFLTLKKDKQIDSSKFTLNQSAKYFADILLHSAIDFSKTKVIVMDISIKELMNNDFLNELKVLIDSSYYNEHFNNNLILVSIADLLDSKDFYILDEHIRASGHQKIAERLNKYIIIEK